MSSGYRTVGDVMSRTVVAVSRDASFKEIATAMERWNVGALPVLDESSQVVGVVSETDLLVTEEQRGVRLSMLAGGGAAAVKAGAATADDLMTAPAVTVTADATVPHAARTMARRGVHRLPVVTAEGKPVGVVTRGDLLKVFLRTDADIAREVREDITVLLRAARPPVGLADHPQVRVGVEEGRVTLSGEVPDASLIPVAARLAGGVEGVVGVRCDLTGPTRPGQGRP